MKKTISKYLDFVILLNKYKKDYFNYYFHNKHKIYKELKNKGIYSIKPSNKDNWKLWYNTCYLSGYISDNNNNRVPVFIKIMGPLLKDCFENEKVVNRYILENSEYLSERLPKILFDIVIGDFYILVYDYLDMKAVEVSAELSSAIERAISEYSKIGILHTDFGIINIGINNNKYIFFDYGTSLCPHSNNIRVRKYDKYNHLDKVTNSALSIIEKPDFYYDDVIHCDIKDINTSDVNFLVGKDDIYYAKLGTNIYKYRLKQNIKGSYAYLLCKEDD